MPNTDQETANLIAFVSMKYQVGNTTIVPTERFVDRAIARIIDNLKLGD